MFSKSKTASKLLENNPILQYYEVGRLFGNGGPEGVWKIYEGVSKTDGRVRKLFLIVVLTSNHQTFEQSI